MQLSQIYAVAAGGCFLAPFLYCTSSFFRSWIQNRTLFFIFKYLIYPILIRRRRMLGPCTYWEAFATLLHWSLTAICNLVGVRDISDFGTRAGTLSIIHLIPLLFSDRLSFAADLLGLSLRTYTAIHGSVGVMAILQGFLHSIVFVTHGTFRMREQRQFYGFLVRVP